MKEIWKDIKGYEGLYQVSNLGRVQSLDTYVKHYRGGLQRKMSRILKPGTRGVKSNRYFCVTLCKNGDRKNIKVSRLVYSHFIGDLIDGMVIDHIDNNSFNDRVYNLQQITQRQNSSKDRKTGISKYTGVIWHKNNKNWVAKIYINGRYNHLGSFSSELDAANAYKKALNNLV